MTNDSIYIPNKNRVYKKLVHLLVLILIVLILYYILRFSINSNYKISLASILGYLTAFCWFLLTEKSIRKITFNNQGEKLVITEKSIFGKEKNHFIKYSELHYKIKKNNKLLCFLFGKKNLILLNNNYELFELRSVEEFNEKEIEEIIKSLNETKNTCC